MVAGSCGGALAAPKGAGGLIDVHHHFFPPFLLADWARRPPEPADILLPAVREWTPQVSLAQMDANGVGTAVVSGLAPGFLSRMPRADMLAVVRGMNEYAAGLRARHDGRFRFFAFLPMPDVSASVAEVGDAIDRLGAVGVSLTTSYDDRWLGDPLFVPLLVELDRRGTVVFVHPRSPACCSALMPQTTKAEAGLLEFPFDTGRTVLSLLASGALARFARIRWIICHAGGPIPVLAGRIRELAPTLIPHLADVAPRGIDHELRRLFYDTANSVFPPTMAALRAYVPPTQVLFGTDFPYVSVARNVELLRAYPLPDADRAALSRLNAATLLGV